MKVFNLKAYRDLKDFGWRSILIIFILFLSIGGSLGFIYVLLATDPWLDSYFNEVNRPDYVYQLDDSTWINQGQLDDMHNLNAIKDYTGRLFWRSSLKLEGVDEVKYILLVGLDPSIDHPHVFDYKIEEGKNFNDNGNNLSVVIDKNFAEKNRRCLNISKLESYRVKNFGRVQCTRIFNHDVESRIFYTNSRLNDCWISLKRRS